MKLNRSYKRVLLMVLGLFMLGCGESDLESTRSPDIVITERVSDSNQVEMDISQTVQEQRLKRIERIIQNNCGGNVPTSGTLQISTTVEHILKGEGEIAFDLDGKIQLFGTGVSLGPAIASKLGLDYGISSERSNTISVGAEAGSYMVHEIAIYEIVAKGEARLIKDTIEKVVPFSFPTGSSAGLKQSLDVGCDASDSIDINDILNIQSAEPEENGIQSEITIVNGDCSGVTIYGSYANFSCEVGSHPTTKNATETPLPTSEIAEGQTTPLSPSLPPPPNSDFELVYKESFDGTKNQLAKNWTPNTLIYSQSTSKRQTQFLGLFGSQLVKFELQDIPEHTELMVTFDLYIIQSWDGSNSNFGPDIFKVYSQNDLDSIYQATFSNIKLEHTGDIDHLQSYPEQFYGELDIGYDPQTSAIVNQLGFEHNGVPMDSVYRISHIFSHEEAELDLNFQAILNEMDNISSTSNESWGIDNIEIHYR